MCSPSFHTAALEINQRCAGRSVQDKSSNGLALTNLVGMVNVKRRFSAPLGKTALLSSTLRAYIESAGASRIWR
jgi:hypothetical protein